MHKHRRAMAAISMVVVLLIIDLMIISMVVGGARDHDLTVRRMDTIRAFYAAEAGMNMAIREKMIGVDEDGDDALNPPADDGIGTISFDDPIPNDANDPGFGTPKNAQFVVTLSADKKTLTSTGRSGDAKREMDALLE